MKENFIIKANNKQLVTQLNFQEKDLVQHINEQRIENESINSEIDQLKKDNKYQKQSK